jgi:RNA polymerase sigma factor (sigma-70 family)
VSAADSKRIEPLLRELAPQVLGSVVRRFGDFAAAEDAVQEALLAGATQWPREGVPDNPRGWLIHVAARRMTDEIRSSVARREREATLARQEWPFHDPASLDSDAPLADDTLTLLFMCCHPALTSPSAIALTLRAVGGLTTAEIAQAFLVPEATMAQRISRAKQTIRQSGIPFEQPGAGERAERLASVLHVLYLVFNEGYTSSGGASLHRADLSDEAIRLARAVHALLPGETEVAGLLALMLLTDARRAARTDASGSIVPLPKQDRALWHRAMIDEGLALVAATLPKGRIGPYQIQAAIAALHDEAARADDTDWPQILALYGVLLRLSDNPVIALNHAVAAAMVHGPRAGLVLVDAIANDARLAGTHRVDAVRAHLLELAGDTDAAVAAYLSAAGRTASLPERNYLATQAARLRGTH